MADIQMVTDSRIVPPMEDIQMTRIASKCRRLREELGDRRKRSNGDEDCHGSATISIPVVNKLDTFVEDLISSDS